MSRIVVAFSRNASREIVSQLIEDCGMQLNGSYRSGEEAIQAIRALGGGVVVSGYRLPDMTADDLAQALTGIGYVLVTASPSNLAQVKHPAIRCISSPISPAAFHDTLAELVHMDEQTPRKRSPEETAMIQRAKDILIRQGMTEQQAHSTLQQRSMKNRCKLSEIARQVIADSEPQS